MYKIAIIAGDLRVAKLIDLFNQNPEFEVKHYGFELLDFENVSKQLKFKTTKSDFEKLRIENLDEILENNQIILLPLPTIKNGCVNSPFSSNKIKFSDLASKIKDDQIVLSGSLGDKLRTKSNIIDYYHGNEELILKNAVTTAEGAVVLAINYSQQQINGRKCLVLGYGRVGKILAHTLKSLSAKVTVGARNLNALTTAESYGLGTLELKKLIQHIHEYEIIFNTIPSIILDKWTLELVNLDSLIMNLADGEGGVDFEFAKRLGLNVVHEGGIPGRIAPITAGKNIYDSVIRVIKERI